MKQVSEGIDSVYWLHIHSVFLSYYLFTHHSPHIKFFILFIYFGIVNLLTSHQCFSFIVTSCQKHLLWFIVHHVTGSDPKRNTSRWKKKNPTKPPPKKSNMTTYIMPMYKNNRALFN